MRKPKKEKLTLRVNNGYPAETLTERLRRVVKSGEKIDSTAPIIYTERKEGVRPEYNVRTDKFEIARKAMDQANKAKIEWRNKYVKKMQGGKIIFEEREKTTPTQTQNEGGE